ncbi:LuxR C-terminal-related transcriptional regulator [Streptomyces sp. NPDC051315]|uniref:LuxR C-terminal-related transcriptional regulator n=1 Tax=Streptomyces sp. NPDC051315 TaxID=3365650 RepID=UPI0037BD78F2
MTSRAGMPLSPRQTQALTAAATGATLTEIGYQLGITREHVSMLLSHAYRRLDVTHLPRHQRRPAAVRAAIRQGIIPNPVKEAASAGPAAAQATEPAHNDGPTVREAAANDRRWWETEKAGEQ